MVLYKQKLKPEVYLHDLVISFIFGLSALNEKLQIVYLCI